MGGSKLFTSTHAFEQKTQNQQMKSNANMNDKKIDCKNTKHDF